MIYKDLMRSVTIQPPWVILPQLRHPVRGHDIASRLQCQVQWFAVEHPEAHKEQAPYRGASLALRCLCV
jgi:hypothetical protein